MADTLWLARHGNRQDFVDPQWTKSAARPYDPGLSPDGTEQAKRLAARLAGEDIKAVFSSPFLRAVETAHEIAETLQIPIYLEPGLSEWYNDEWFPGAPETMPAEELLERYPRVDLSYESEVQPQYGESENEAMRRSAVAAHSIARRVDEPVLLLGHSVSVTGVTKGLDPDAHVPECGMCCLYRFARAGDEWEVVLRADVSHLDEVVAANRRI